MKDKRQLKLVLQDNVGVQKLIDLGFKTIDNWKLVKKVYCADDDDNKNFYSIDMITREIEVSLQSKYLDSTIYDLITAGVISTDYIRTSNNA